MAKNYLEVTIEGDYKAIKGLLEGFLLGSGIEGEYYFCKNSGVESETLMESFKELIHLKNIHHLIMDAALFTKFSDALKKLKEDKFISIKYIKAAKPIKDASFKFIGKTYGKKYGDEIKEMIKNLSPDLKMNDYKEKEEIQKDAKGVELYSPDHDYALEATGRVSGANIKALLEFRKKLDDHPLVEVEKIILIL
jgi:hypothetical protein